MEYGEQRSGTNEKDAPSDLFDAVGDGDAVQRAEFQYSQDKESSVPGRISVGLIGAKRVYWS